MKKQLYFPLVLTLLASLVFSILPWGQPATVYAAPDTVILRPNDVGDYQEWSSNTNTDYEDTSDVSDSTYIYALTEGHRDLMNIADHSTCSGTINSVTVWMRVQVDKGSGKAEKGAIYIKTNENYYTGTPQTFPDSPNWSDFSEVYSTNPQSELAWTWDEVDALQAGIITTQLSSGEEMRCAEIWVVDYNPPPTIEFTSSASSGAESVTAVDLQLKLSATSVQDVSV
ncbi:MAG: hypothetical protein JSV32_01625, partial [Dehalococcoidia bacterium]